MVGFESLCGRFFLQGIRFIQENHHTISGSLGAFDIPNGIVPDIDTFLRLYPDSAGRFQVNLGVWLSDTDS
jgi:hypothetical protein